MKDIKQFLKEEHITESDFQDNGVPDLIGSLILKYHSQHTLSREKIVDILNEYSNTDLDWLIKTYGENATFIDPMDYHKIQDAILASPTAEKEKCEHEKCCQNCKFVDDDSAWECTKCDDKFCMWKTDVDYHNDIFGPGEDNYGRDKKGIKELLKDKVKLEEKQYCEFCKYITIHKNGICVKCESKSQPQPEVSDKEIFEEARKYILKQDGDFNSFCDGMKTMCSILTGKNRQKSKFKTTEPLK